METLLSNIQTILGPLLVGALCAAAMYGVTCIQTVHYLYKHSRDNRWYKLCVCMLWMLDTFHMFMISHFTYWFLVSNYLNVLALANPDWSNILFLYIVSLCDVLVRIMFARRVWLLSKGNITITAIIVSNTYVIVILSWVAGLEKRGHQSQLPSLYAQAPLYVSFAAILVADSTVALSLSWYLWRSRTGFKRTDNLITILLVYVVGTGMVSLPITRSTTDVFYILGPMNYVYMATYMLMPKLYLNSLLYSLNARDMVKGDSDGIISIHLSHIQERSSTANTRRVYDSASDAERASVIPTFDLRASAKEVDPPSPNQKV
ncbi:hypothetical protein PUNSTDRAFT_77651 [Punctularia strigosozonata HHB-11173 SS5]|uniref:DUF6534 domain-containing protein n=1 Tax=Punctularia strigosozonata (strain HHB-11173) TaxID=741275 RepID=R7S0D2_PUNST|nr:uncharacterized protein PUNSTDRAFT_77651 [Punctularia strigosozonata HHB-11173 SS5]EIN03693.1 hypothetical protein PUNSTDRAFT_77651 [Punctularia strigosozonata HHB-11173 SS5]